LDRGNEKKKAAGELVIQKKKKERSNTREKLLVGKYQQRKGNFNCKGFSGLEKL